MDATEKIGRDSRCAAAWSYSEMKGETWRGKAGFFGRKHFPALKNPSSEDRTKSTTAGRSSTFENK